MLFTPVILKLFHISNSVYLKLFLLFCSLSSCNNKVGSCSEALVVFRHLDICDSGVAIMAQRRLMWIKAVWNPRKLWLHFLSCSQNVAVSWCHVCSHVPVPLLISSGLLVIVGDISVQSGMIFDPSLWTFMHWWTMDCNDPVLLCKV